MVCIPSILLCPPLSSDQARNTDTATQSHWLKQADSLLKVNKKSMAPLPSRAYQWLQDQQIYKKSYKLSPPLFS